MLRTRVDFWRGLNTIEKKENTSRVCSRHFREGDIKKPFSGKIEVETRSCSLYYSVDLNITTQKKGADAKIL